MQPRKIFALGGAITAGLIALTVLGGSYYTVDQGDRGVILRNGKIIGTAEPGFGLKVPFIDRVVEISTRTFSKVYEGLPAYSRDQQGAVIQVSVTFNVPDSETALVYEDFGSVEAMVTRLLDRQVNEQLRNVFGRFNAVTAVQERERLTNEFRLAVVESVEGPIEISGVQIENIDFSNAYEESIEQRMLAEVEVQKVRQNAERQRVEAEIVVINADAAAKARTAEAVAEAEAIRVTGEAEASAIVARGAALRDNPSLISLVTAEKWNGQLPSTMVPGSTLPFLQLDDGNGLNTGSTRAANTNAAPSQEPAAANR